MHAFLLAGGYATRLWPLTERRAKPLLPLAGKPMVSHILEGIPAEIPVTVSTNAAFEKDFLAWKAGTGRANLKVVIERTRSDDEKLGALGALAQWAETEKIDDDVLLLAGDNYLGFSIARFLQAFHPDTALIAAYDIGGKEEAKKFGTVVTGPDGVTVTGFEEKPAEPKTTLVSTGCAVLPKSALPILQDYAKRKPDNLGGIFEELLAKGRKVECFRFTERWFDVGSFEAYLEATRALAGERMVMAEGVTFERSTSEGAVVIGKGCVIRDCRLRDVVVFEGCVLEDCVLERCVIDDNCRLLRTDLTGKMLRKGTVLERKEAF